MPYPTRVAAGTTTILSQDPLWHPRGEWDRVSRHTDIAQRTGSSHGWLREHESRPRRTGSSDGQTPKLVAGAGFEPATFGL